MGNRRFTEAPLAVQCVLGGVALTFGAPTAIWHADVYVVSSDAAGIHGELAVEPVNTDGVLMDRITVLDWSY